MEVVLHCKRTFAIFLFFFSPFFFFFLSTHWLPSCVRIQIRAAISVGVHGLQAAPWIDIAKKPRQTAACFLSRICPPGSYAGVIMNNANTSSFFTLTCQTSFIDKRTVVTRRENIINGRRFFWWKSKFRDFTWKWWSSTGEPQLAASVHNHQSSVDDCVCHWGFRWCTDIIHSRRETSLHTHDSWLLTLERNWKKYLDLLMR